MVGDSLDEIQKTFEEHKTHILEEGDFEDGVPVSSDYERLNALVTRVKSDPFIPKEIRDYVTTHLENRANKIMSIHFTEIRGYMKELAQGKFGKDYSHDKAVVHNRINSLLHENNCGIDQVEQQVHQIRLFIQQYLEGFNPLKR